METHSQNQRERLNYIDFRVYFTGRIGRADLTERFGISDAAATRDLAIYRDEVPGNIEMDHVTKSYRITDSFKPFYISEIDSKSILRALVHGIGDDFGVPPAPLVQCELPTRLHAPDIKILAVVSRAIHGQRVLEVDYLSASGGQGTRELVPFALVGNGLRWHVRAYDRRRDRFGDFIINRIRSARALEGAESLARERKDHDDEWNRMVNLEIVPHPDYEQKAMIEAEYGMEDGVIRHKARGAMVGYILRLWNVDCSPDHRLGPNHCHLWLRNRMALYGIDNAKIAPGFDGDA
jgi:predicted DNA-binding transcriptional regulator YafY